MDTQVKHSVKTRFAPSPTGHLHLGNVRTALYSALFAWQQGGQFLLRFEDTDLERSQQAYADSIMADLQWLGLTWDEGPSEASGEHAPYYQAQRTDIYDQYYQQLEEKGLAYPCFCSAEKLAMVRKSQLSSGQPPRYPGTCARLNAAEVAEKRAQGQVPTLRFKIEAGDDICFHDQLKGDQSFRRQDIGDFIIRRADGSTAFFFSNAIDDALMGVTHVVRGEDHITNTPRQMMILQALDLRVPAYAHTPMLLGDDGSLLSKRHGSFSVKEMCEAGYLPQAIVNYLGRIGQAVDHDACLPARELAEHFILTKMSKSSARFDQAQLHFWQKQAVSQLTAEQALQWSGLQNDIPAEKTQVFFSVILPNVTFAHEIKAWANIMLKTLENASEEAQQVLKETPADFFKAATESFQSVGEDYKAFANVLKEKSGQKGKQLFMPLRAALTGRLDGPAIPDILALLGAEAVQQRFKDYSSLITC